MPFPWKKMKSTRISQLVNDHLHKSQKRRDGSSLVVATGFPTSLIDLIIKNREKLKKQSKRKRQNHVSDADEQSIREPPPPPPPSIAGSPLRSPSLPPPPPPPIAGAQISTNTPLPLPFSEISAVGTSVDERESGDGNRVDVNRVLLGVLKMFLVVVFALGAKRLTVGITLSAFLLLFLEFVGNQSYRLSNKPVLRSIVRSVSRVFRFKKVKQDEIKGGILMKNNSYPDQEIRVVEEIQPVNEITEEPYFEKGLGCQEFESSMDKELVPDVVECGKKSRRAKIKSKMKKLVPKKFKISRKDNGHHTTQTKTASYEDQHEGEMEIVSRSSSSISGGRCRREGEMEIVSRSSSSISGGRCREDNGTVEIRRLLGEDDKNGEEKGLVSEGGGLTWKHVVVCLIVLIGLIGGRGFALALTLSWFLMLKLGEMVRRRMKIKSCNEKCC